MKPEVKTTEILAMNENATLMLVRRVHPTKKAVSELFMSAPGETPQLLMVEAGEKKSLILWKAALAIGNSFMELQTAPHNSRWMREGEATYDGKRHPITPPHISIDGPSNFINDEHEIHIMPDKSAAESSLAVLKEYLEGHCDADDIVELAHLIDAGLPQIILAKTCKAAVELAVALENLGHQTTVQKHKKP